MSENTDLLLEAQRLLAASADYPQAAAVRDARDELTRLRTACEMMIDAYGLDIFTFKAKYDRKEQADQQAWILLALRTIDAALTNAREVPHPTN